MSFYKNPLKLVLFLAMLGIASCSGGDDSGSATDAATNSNAADATVLTSASRLADIDWLKTKLGDSQVQIVDIRSNADYATSRIPGALRVDVSGLRATVNGVPGQVTSAEVVGAAFAAAGIKKATTVVAYSSGIDTSVGRLAWTLEHFGHQDVRILDGGFSAWSAASFTLETTAPSTLASDYATPSAVPELVVDGEWIKGKLDDATVSLVDARTSGEYDSGHIPGAVHVNWKTNLSNGLFKPASTVAALYAGISMDNTVVVYCQSGARASISYFVLRWLGYKDVRLYDGSWAQWGSQSDFPIETS